MTNAELADHLLRRLYDLAEEEGYDRLHSLEAIAAEVGVDDRMKVMGVAQALEQEELIQAAHTFGGSDARILGRGAIQAESRLSGENNFGLMPPAMIIRERIGSVEGISGLTFEALLHPVVSENAYRLWTNGHFREAALNAVISVFDLVRERTHLDVDGEQLATRAFSASSPHLAVADINTSSGRNDQIGFMQLLQGAYRGLRTPQAHTLRHALTREESARYLVLASVLAARVEMASHIQRGDET